MLTIKLLIYRVILGLILLPNQPILLFSSYKIFLLHDENYKIKLVVLYFILKFQNNNFLSVFKEILLVNSTKPPKQFKNFPINFFVFYSFSSHNKIEGLKLRSESLSIVHFKQRNH